VPFEGACLALAAANNKIRDLLNVQGTGQLSPHARVFFNLSTGQENDFLRPQQVHPLANNASTAM
jgi:hypothetical protein